MSEPTPDFESFDVLPTAAKLERGEFLPDMTDAEVLEYERTERLGWKNFRLPWQKQND